MLRRWFIAPFWRNGRRLVQGKMCATLSMLIPGGAMTMVTPSGTMELFAPGGAMAMTAPGGDVDLLTPGGTMTIEDCD